MINIFIDIFIYLHIYLCIYLYYICIFIYIYLLILRGTLNHSKTGYTFCDIDVYGMSIPWYCIGKVTEASQGHYVWGGGGGDD